MRFKTQDPKYDIEVKDGDAYLVNAISGVPIPKDEPIFTIRAQDSKALPTLRFYRTKCHIQSHSQIVQQRIDEFSQFAEEQEAKMKEPDTVPWV